MQFIVLLFLVAVARTSAFSLTEWLNRHITGGSNATADIYLYQVSLERNGNHVCGGVLVSEKHVITAAHCLFNDNGREDLEITIRGGSLYRSKGKIYSWNKSSDDRKIPECYRYDKTNLECDIAVLYLTGTPKLKEFVKLATKEPKDRTTLTVTGWGLNGPSFWNQPDRLQVVKVQTVERTRCRLSYNGNYAITENMICAGGMDIRKGDSGGPLVEEVNDTLRLVGIVAGGIPEAISWRGNPPHPGIYTSVTSPTIKAFLEKNLQ